MTHPFYDSLRQLFLQPPLDYSDFVTWFWETGELDKERITWQLEELKKKGVGGTWYYPRYLNGERYGTDPAYFSEEWWEFFRHSVAEHERLGLEAWFSGWEGREYWQDLLRAERAARPELHGRRLVIHEARSQEEGTLQLDLPQGETILAAAVFRIEDGGLDPDSSRKLAPPEPGQPLAWDAPEPGWLLAAVASQPHDLDYLNPHVAARYLEIYWQEHEERLRDFVPGTLSLYGQDELYVLNGNILYAPELAARFKAEKGYDPAPHLFGLFHDIGDFTDKIRCDYYEVMSALLEENLYRPLCEWHEERGMRYGTIATWGRQDLLGQTWHYGDFFRLMRWFHVTGNEDPGASLPGERCFIDAKLSSSVLHIYRRERAAMCVYWGSGWGMTQEQNIAWTNENYAYGLNLYNQHGGLYNTLGGWYEWVPPSVHWRQPYWEHWQTFVDYVSRLSAVMSQGTHVADVALLYPLTTVHANWLRGDSFTSAADDCAMTTFSLARQIYEAGIDFDFVDDNLLSEAVVRDGTLEIAGIRFRAVLLPPMTTIRRQTLAKLREFYDGGGAVVAFRRLPGASQEHGRDDPEVRALLQHIFGIASSEEAVHRTEAHSQALGSIYRQRNENGGLGIFLPGQETARTPHAAQRGVNIAAVISDAIDRDVVASGRNVFHTHQRSDGLEIYFLYNVEPERRELTFSLRAQGEPEIWDCWSGEALPHHRFAHQENNRTAIRLTMEANQGIVMVFRAPARRPAVTADNLDAITRVTAAADTIEVGGLVNNGGAKFVRLRHAGRDYAAQARVAPPPDPVHLTGDWTFQLKPTMDNRWGDFREPRSSELIGAEARQFRYRTEEGAAGVALGWHSRDHDYGNWPLVTYTFGPYWRASCPFKRGETPQELADLLAGNAAARSDSAFRWQDVSYSQEFGQPGTEEWGGSHGVGDSFLCLDASDESEECVRYLYTHVHAPCDGQWTLHLGADSGQVERVWLNGSALLPDEPGKPVPATVDVALKEGANYLLLACVQPPAEPLRAYVALLEPATTPVRNRAAGRLTWFAKPTELVYDVAPDQETSVGWYRFEAPAGTRTLFPDVDAENVQLWINGEAATVRDGQVRLDAPLAELSQIALRIEHRPGCYAGAAIRQPVRFECAASSMPLGDWSQQALKSYSGGGVYTKGFSLAREHLHGQVVLDLGAVNTTAEVAVNGRSVGVGLARPYRFDITEYVRAGDNELEVTVFNTLANYFSTGPYESDYVFPGQTVSGLLGPVTIAFPARITLAAKPHWSADSR